ncbi:hypothetical protein AMAG_03391 [Allomyces macrogynus ATCC 38327]|uniref:BAG domain-containing protein n=1 Tax=Allomyces macrogynus (strain ATCC 38327) TaxID=578462 RepID=A0A0L0S9B1_ALLM3|nr:hypothetical protein AMAG_03391 [Allomyces macrogynus ATCC 38327]|eukprot:KNE59042.1 hypothetical protein AMAG_03391 [Allomyces macrogynus ATCC 38327]
MPISLHFGKHRYPVVFDRPLSMVPLAELVKAAADATHLPMATIRLVYAGAVLMPAAAHLVDELGIMKDMTATLAQYGIHSDAKILVLGNKQPAATPGSTSSSAASSAPAIPPRTSSAAAPGASLSATVASDPREQAVVDTVSNLVATTLQPLNPRLDQFANATNSRTPTMPPNDLAKLKAELCERLMQALLKVDSVTVPPGFDIARSKRREAVNTLQKLMDDVEARYRAVVAGEDGTAEQRPRSPRPY